MEEKDIIAQNIAYYRKKCGLSQLELAEKLQYSNKNISKWENGETTPSIFTLKRLAEIFEITVDELISETPTDEPTEDAKPPRALKRGLSLLGKAFYLLMANAVLLAAACVAVWILGILQIKVFNRWLILLYATPLSALSVFIFLTCTQKRMDMIFISVFYLLAAICIFVTFRKTANIGFVFIVAAAFELLTISIALIINHQLAARKRAREQAAKS